MPSSMRRSAPAGAAAGAAPWRTNNTAGAASTCSSAHAPASWQPLRASAMAADNRCTEAPSASYDLRSISSTPSLGPGEQERIGADGCPALAGAMAADELFLGNPEHCTGAGYEGLGVDEMEAVTGERGNDHSATFWEVGANGFEMVDE